MSRTGGAAACIPQATPRSPILSSIRTQARVAAAAQISPAARSSCSTPHSRNNFTSAGNGGGVKLSCGKLNGANLTFHQNIANADGAQLMVAGGTATLNSSTFESGGAGGNGGGIATKHA